MARGKSKAKQTKAFLKKGLLEGQIKRRHQARDLKQKIQNRKVQRNRKGAGHPQNTNKQAESDQEDDIDALPAPKLQNESDSDEEEEQDVPESDSEASLSSMSEDDLEADLSSDEESEVDEDKHLADLEALAEKDPKFYQYLQENDQDLLRFATDGAVSIEEASDSEGEADTTLNDSKASEGEEQEALPTLTVPIVKEWQRQLLKSYSLRTLRKLLVAFRACVVAESDDNSAAAQWNVRSSAAFDKAVKAALKFTPVVFAHHFPVTNSKGKSSFNSSSKHFGSSLKLLKSFFVSLQSLIASLPRDSELAVVGVAESAKLLPYVVSNRKIARAWSKTLLDLYASGSDEIRIAAVAALRVLAGSGDASACQSVVKGVYATLLESMRKTSIYTLPTITLMKNSAAELFLLEGKQGTSICYRMAFTYIRMLSLLLRKAVKDGTPDSFKAVYSWQFAHAIDFWSIVLSAAADRDRANGSDSPLKQLCYPLVQLALGSIRLVPTSRYFPFRFHIIRSLLRLVRRTGHFVALAAPLFEVLDSPELTGRLKPATLKPLDLEYYVRCPASYLRTRIYADALAEEAVYLLTEYYAALSTSIAFPELVLPAIVSLKKTSKRSGQAKLASHLKVLLEKLASNSAFIEKQRATVDFAPQQLDRVDRFLLDASPDSTPLGVYAKVGRKNREEKREMLERAANDDDD